MKEKLERLADITLGAESEKPIKEYGIWVRCPWCSGSGRACGACDGRGMIENCKPCEKCEFTGYLRKD